MKSRLNLKTSWWLSLIILTFIAGTASAQNRASADSCALVSSDVLFPSPGASKPERPPHEAVIFGKEFPVPELHLRFISQETGKPITPKVVHVAYGWKWLEWPYPEHAWGAWSDAQDSVECTTGGNNGLVVPEHTVQPRGWYNGKYTRFPYTLSGSKEPYFDGLVVVVEFGNDCRPRLQITKGDLDRYKSATAILNLPCQWPVKVQFEKRTAPHQSAGRVMQKNGSGWGHGHTVLDFQNKPFKAVKGTVEAVYNKPIEGALVEIYQYHAHDPLPQQTDQTVDSPPRLAACVTGETGKFGFDLPSSRYEVRVSKPGWNSTSALVVVDVRRGKRRSLTIPLKVGT